MSTDTRLQISNALTLQWHAGTAKIAFEAFRRWILTTLKPRLPFDGAIWGLMGDTGSTGTHINGTYLHHIADSAMERFERLRADELSGSRHEGQVIDISLTDMGWQAAEFTELREHGSRFGLTNTISARFSDPYAPGRQFLMLARGAIGHRFDAEETRQFEMLAPHMMQAYATNRRLTLESLRGTGRTLAGLAVAVVDRAGEVHDHDASFGPMLRREWSDWSGTRLPDPVREVLARRAGVRWRFLGAQVLAEFAPVDDMYLVTARPRHAADPLTPRESDVARRYAAGGSFREIATVLELSPATVRSHLRNVFGKMHVRNKTQLASLLR